MSETRAGNLHLGSCRRPRSAPKEIILSQVSAALNTPIHRLHPNLSFVENGGDSLSAIQLHGGLKSYGIRTSQDCIFQSRTILEIADSSFFEPLPSLPDDLFQRCPRDSETHDDNAHEAPRKRRRTSFRPLERQKSPLGRRRWPMTELQSTLIRSTQHNSHHNVISYFEVHRPESIPALKEAWKKVLKQEPIFNLDFQLHSTSGFMCSDDKPFTWEETRVGNERAYMGAVEHPLLPDMHIGYSFKVITLVNGGGEGQSTVVWRVHHALIDGVSCAIVRSKVQDLLCGRPTLSSTPFVDFSLQLNSLQRQGHDSAVAFWKRKQQHPFSNSATQLPTPTKPRNGIEQPLVNRIYVHSDFEKLAAYARYAGVTVASLHYAAWGLVFAKYSDTLRVCFGAVLSGRSLPIDGIESVVGPTINTLPLYLALDSSSSVDEYTRQVFDALLELSEFQWSTPEQGFVRDFSSAVNVRCETPLSNGSPFDPIEEPWDTVASDIPLRIEVGSNGRICIDYNTKIYHKAYVARLGAALASTLVALLEPNATVASCLEAGVDHDQRLSLSKMGNWQGPSTTHRSVQHDLVSLFERTARENPTVTAVEHCGQTLTYSQLDAASAYVAHSLSQLITFGDVVCMHADRTTNWIIGIYAILRAGGIYCPLDPDVPTAVRLENFASANAKLFLTGISKDKDVTPCSSAPCLSVEELLRADRSQSLKARTSNPESCAYLCFTSGSSGKPKGVLCRHRGLVAFQQDFDVRLRARPGWKIAQVMSPAFDGSIHEIFSALSYGATLVLRDKNNPFSHLKKCDAAVLTPSVAQALDTREFPDLKAVYLVGEAVPQGVCDTWASEKQVFNMYGPTEATCGATIKALTAGTPVTLGGPNPSTRVYVLDSARRVAPWGAVGEIFLAGVQVAAGYIHRPEETTQRFLPDSIHPELSGEYMYKTGDRGYWSEGGELVFVGRNDRQVKLRGFRIDLDDLEVRLTAADENCTAAAVAVRGDTIFALVQPSSLDLNSYLTRVRRLIHTYALPQHVVAIDAFPMTPAGKIDYRAVSNTSPEVPLDAPSNTDEMVSNAIRDILGLLGDAEVDHERSFSDMGASSVHGLLLSHRLSRLFHQHVSVRMIWDAMKIRDLSRVLETSQRPADQDQTVSLGASAVSPIEKDWWCKYKCNSQTSSFNVTYACWLPTSVDVKKLVASWKRVLNRHPLLWSRYRSSSDGEVTRELSTIPPGVEELQSIDIDFESNRTFDLANDSLIRVFVTPTQMLAVISHIVCDSTTLRILLHEVADTYYGKHCAPVARTYFQTNWTNTAPPQNLAFWSDYLSGSQKPRLSLGRHISRRTWSGYSRTCTFPAQTYQDMRRFATANGVTMHQVALSAVALALHPYTNAKDITVGAPYLNRNSEDDLGVVGLFLEPLPIRIRFPDLAQHPDSANQGSFVKVVQRASRAALSHAVPWDQLLSHLGIEAKHPNHPLFDVMVTFHEVEQETCFGIDGVEFIPTWTKGAKFPLMAEFTVRENGTLALRLEYSDEIFATADMAKLEGMIREALAGLFNGGSFDLMSKRLKSCRERQDCEVSPYGRVDAKGRHLSE